MSVIVLSPEDPMENRSPETPFIDFEDATPLPSNGNHSPTASPMPPASVIDDGDSTLPTVNNDQLLAIASPVASSMPLFNDSPVGSPRSSVVSVPASPIPVPVSPAPVPVSPIPVPVSPAPVPVSPIPVPVSPVSVPASPVPVPVSPAPVPVSPAPVPVSPIPVPVSPAPVPVSPVSVPVSPINETVTPAKSPLSLMTGPLSPMDQSQYPLATMSPLTMSDEEEDEEEEEDDYDDYQEVLYKITSLPLLLSPLPPSPPPPLPSTSQVRLSSSSQISPSTLNPQTPSISPLLSLNRRLSSPITPLPPSPCLKATVPSGSSSAGLPPSSCRVNLLKSFSQISEASSLVSRQCVLDGGGESIHDKIIMINSDDDDDDGMGWESNCKEMLSLPSLLSPLPSTPLPPPVVPSSSIECINKPLSPSSSGQSESRVEKEPDLREEAEHVDDADLVIDIDPGIKFDSVESSSQPLDPLIAPMTRNTDSLMVDVVAVGYTNLPNSSPSLSETNIHHHSEPGLSSTKEIMTDVHDKDEKEIVPDNATGQCISTTNDLLSPTQQTPSLPPPSSSLSPAQPLPVYSQSQLELPDYMKCAHPLPHWLIYSMKQVQDKKEEMLYTAAGGNGKKCFLFHSDRKF